MKFRYIVDANVLMSILISGKSQYINMLTLVEFIMPDFAFIELNLYREIITQKSKLDEEQFRLFSYTVFSLIEFIPTFVLKKVSTEQSIELCKNIDIKDSAYVALAIDTKLTLLTRDEKLFKGLRKQGFKQIELFENFLKQL